ncbi:MAG: gamma-glutamylcyclotransferase family protein, partial [Ilumatobacteraceae bacterium]
MREDIHHVFVYGTLTDPYIRRMVIGEDIDDPEYGVPLTGYVVLNDHGNSFGTKFPRLAPHDDGVVYGVVLTVDERQLASLDRYEGNDSFYERRLIPSDSIMPPSNDIWAYFAIRKEAHESTPGS